MSWFISKLLIVYYMMELVHTSYLNLPL